MRRPGWFASILTAAVITMSAGCGSGDPYATDDVSDDLPTTEVAGNDTPTAAEPDGSAALGPVARLDVETVFHAHDVSCGGMEGDTKEALTAEWEGWFEEEHSPEDHWTPESIEEHGKRLRALLAAAEPLPAGAVLYEVECSPPDGAVERRGDIWAHTDAGGPSTSDEVFLVAVSDLNVMVRELRDLGAPLDVSDYRD